MSLLGRSKTEVPALRRDVYFNIRIAPRQSYAVPTAGCTNCLKARPSSSIFRIGRSGSPFLQLFINRQLENNRRPPGSQIDLSHTGFLFRLTSVRQHCCGGLMTVPGHCEAVYESRKASTQGVERQCRLCCSASINALRTAGALNLIFW